MRKSALLFAVILGFGLPTEAYSRDRIDEEAVSQVKAVAKENGRNLSRQAVRDLITIAAKNGIDLQGPAIDMMKIGSAKRFAVKREKAAADLGCIVARALDIRVCGEMDKDTATGKPGTIKGERDGRDRTRDGQFDRTPAERDRMGRTA